MRSDREPGDGTIIDGAAISVIDRGYPGGEPYVDIQGGKFVSEKSEAILAYTWSKTATPNPPTGLMPETMWT